MLLLAYFLYRILSTLRYCASRRLTPAGWLVLAGMSISGPVGVDLEQSIASQTFAILLCLSLVAMLWAFAFRARFVIERRLPRFGSVGHPFASRVSVRNQGDTPWRELEYFEDLPDSRPRWKEFSRSHGPSPGSRSFRLAKPKPGALQHRRAVVKSISLPPVPRGGEVEGRLEVLPLKRGPLRFAGATLASRDPIGLFRGFVRVPLPQTVLILPKRYRLPAIALPGTHKYHQGGVAFAASVGESEEFVSLRDYRPGDPLRHVHWRSSARAGRLVVKEFEDEFFVRHALVLDTFGPPELAETFEEAVSLAASLASTVDTQESLLDLMFVGAQAVCFTTGRGLAHPDQAMEVLASVQLSAVKPFSALQTLVLQHAPVLSGCICIFLAWDEPRRELVRKLTSLGLPLLVLVVTDAAGARELAGLAVADRPAHFLVLEAGKMEAGLQALKGAAFSHA